MSLNKFAPVEIEQIVTVKFDFSRRNDKFQYLYSAKENIWTFLLEIAQI